MIGRRISALSDRWGTNNHGHRAYSEHTVHTIPLIRALLKILLTYIVDLSGRTSNPALASKCGAEPLAFEGPTTQVQRAPPVDTVTRVSRPKRQSRNLPKDLQRGLCPSDCAKANWRPTADELDLQTYRSGVPFLSEIVDQPQLMRSGARTLVPFEARIDQRPRSSP